MLLVSKCWLSHVTDHVFDVHVTVAFLHYVTIIKVIAQLYFLQIKALFAHSLTYFRTRVQRSLICPRFSVVFVPRIILKKNLLC